jgi:hypothetical protein
MIEGDCYQLSEYLRCTKRAVDALFDQRGLEDLGGGAFHYLARPVRMVFWDVVPFLSFHIEQPSLSESREFDLKLVLDNCQLAGDDRWSVVGDNLTFDCHASFKARLGGVHAKASAASTIRVSGWLRLFPEVAIQELATPVIDWVLNRLVMRCEKSMRKDMEQWLKQASSVSTL